MSLAWIRQGVRAIGRLALVSVGMAIVVGGPALAADTLPPLRVDPTLLGGESLKPAPAPPKIEKPVAAQPATAARPVAESSPPAAPPATPRGGAEVTPVAPPPAVRELPTVPAARQSTVARPAPPATVAPAAPAPTVQPAMPPAAARTAQNLPPLRVDPALLGGAPLVRQAAAAPAAAGQQPRATAAPKTTAQNLPLLRVDPALLGEPLLATQPGIAEPPLVAEREAVPPLYSAHLAAGLLPPHPSTTPMSHVDKNSAPTFVIARKISGINDVEMTAEGNAELIRAGDALRGDIIKYRVADDAVEAEGNVVLSSPDMTVRGPRMRLRMEESIGEFVSPAYAIRKEQKPVMEPALTISGIPATDEKGKVLVGTGKLINLPPIIGSGTASQLEFRGEDLYHLKNATYSTCAPEKREWSIHVDELDLDYNSEQGKGRNATVTFLDVPIFYSPWIDFSLNNERKSGFLPGMFGSTNKSGFEVSLPWYWNIAPDMDATVTSRVMSRRGLQLNTEYRYLLDTPWNRRPHAYGAPDRAIVNLEYLPEDTLAQRDRYGYSMQYNQHFSENLKAELNLNGVSDDAYFSDLSTHVAQVSQGSLLRQGRLLYRGPWYGAALNIQTFQSLQDSSSNYRRLPQITAYANRYGLPLGLAVDFSAEYVNFDHPTELLGKRTTLYPQLSLPITTSSFFFTPKVGLHSTQYELSGQRRLAAGDYRKNVPDQLDRTVPIFSTDAGLAFERNFELFDKSLIQTLEPRAYYLYIPQRDQSRIPVFDTASSSFNYAQIFSENRYAGGDRIGDANHLTMAVTSRLLDAGTGSDLLRASLGTRYYFTGQSVTLPAPFNETRRTERKADILAALTGQVLPNTYADIGWQYNPRDNQLERLALGGRYRPANGQIINAGYRLDRSTNLKQFDVSGQWPLFGGWDGVGRYNYSINEHRVIETIGGLEYSAGCWVGRFVVQRLATIAEKPTTAVFFQLELNDFSKIGSNPLQLLHRNIPGYGIVNQPASDPLLLTH